MRAQSEANLSNHKSVKRCNERLLFKSERFFNWTPGPRNCHRNAPTSFLSRNHCHLRLSSFTRLLKFELSLGRFIPHLICYQLSTLPLSQLVHNTTEISKRSANTVWYLKTHILVLPSYPFTTCAKEISPE